VFDEGAVNVAGILAAADQLSVDAQPVGHKVRPPLGKDVDGVRGLGIQHGPFDTGQIPDLDQAGEDDFCCTAMG
jgi:hypothetical protein